MRREGDTAMPSKQRQATGAGVIAPNRAAFALVSRKSNVITDPRCRCRIQLRYTMGGWELKIF